MYYSRPLLYDIIKVSIQNWNHYSEVASTDAKH